jgi:hypothetical protein
LLPTLAALRCRHPKSPKLSSLTPLVPRSERSLGPSHGSPTVARHTPLPSLFPQKSSHLGKVRSISLLSADPHTKALPPSLARSTTVAESHPSCKIRSAGKVRSEKSAQFSAHALSAPREGHQALPPSLAGGTTVAGLHPSFPPQPATKNGHLGEVRSEKFAQKSLLREVRSGKSAPLLSLCADVV